MGSCVVFLRLSNCVCVCVVRVTLRIGWLVVGMFHEWIDCHEQHFFMPMTHYVGMITRTILST